MVRFLYPLDSRNAIHPLIVITALLFFAVGLFFIQPAEAANLQNRRMQMSNASAGASNVEYAVSFDIATPGTLGSIEILFCANSPLLNEPCTPPAGFSAATAQLTQQSGATGFSVSNLSGVNSVILTRSPAANGAVAASYTFSQITNPGSGPFYARVLTYQTDDATGAFTDAGGLALSIDEGFPVSAEVPPYLIFCSGVLVNSFDCSSAEGSSINLGQLNSVSASTAQSQIVAATNAESGYVVTISGTTMTSGNNILPAMQSVASQPGTNQFGINLRANSNPAIGQNPQGPGSGTPRIAYNQPNIYTFNNGQQVAFGNGVQDYRKFTISYIVNTAQGQAPGVYATTLTYICLATF